MIFLHINLCSESHTLHSADSFILGVYSFFFIFFPLLHYINLFLAFPSDLLYGMLLSLSVLKAHKLLWLTRVFMVMRRKLRVIFAEYIMCSCPCCPFRRHMYEMLHFQKNVLVYGVLFSIRRSTG